MMRNRRRSARLPVGFYVDQIVGDDPHRCFTTDLSAIGLYMERRVEPLRRSSKIVQLEIPLPQTSDSIWAKGEVIYDRFDALFHGTAVRLTGMARAHQRMLREWLRESARRDRISAHPLRPNVFVHRPHDLALV
jgi:hypothetical protein